MNQPERHFCHNPDCLREFLTLEPDTRICPTCEGEANPENNVDYRSPIGSDLRKKGLDACVLNGRPESDKWRLLNKPAPCYCPLCYDVNQIKEGHPPPNSTTPHNYSNVVINPATQLSLPPIPDQRGSSKLLMPAGENPTVSCEPIRVGKDYESNRVIARVTTLPKTGGCAFCKAKDQRLTYQVGRSVALLIPTYLFDFQQQKWICSWRKVSNSPNIPQFPRSAFKRERLPNGEYYQVCVDRANCLERLANSNQSPPRYKQQGKCPHGMKRLGRLAGKVICVDCDTECAAAFKKAGLLNR